MCRLILAAHTDNTSKQHAKLDHNLLYIDDHASMRLIHAETIRRSLVACEPTDSRVALNDNLLMKKK